MYVCIHKQTHTLGVLLRARAQTHTHTHTHTLAVFAPSSIDMYNNDVGKRFMK
jgi:hypothetical protein